MVADRIRSRDRQPPPAASRGTGVAPACRPRLPDRPAHTPPRHRGPGRRAPPAGLRRSPPCTMKRGISATPMPCTAASATMAWWWKRGPRKPSIVGLAHHGEPIGPGARPCRMLQQRVSRQIGNRCQSSAFEQGRRADRQAQVGHQAVAGDARPRPGIQHDRRIDILRGEVERRRPRRVVAEIHHDAPMRREEARQPWHQPARAEGRLHREGQRAARALMREHLQRRALDPRQRGADLRRIGRAGTGQHQALPDAQEQPLAEQCLQPCQLPADRALRQVQLLRRAGDRQVPRTGLEGLQRGGGRGVAAHRRPPASFQTIMKA